MKVRGESEKVCVGECSMNKECVGRSGGMFPQGNFGS